MSLNDERTVRLPDAASPESLEGRVGPAETSDAQAGGADAEFPTVLDVRPPTLQRGITPDEKYDPDGPTAQRFDRRLLQAIDWDPSEQTVELTSSKISAPLPAPAEGPRGKSPPAKAPRGEAPRGKSPPAKAPRGEAPRGEAPRGEAPRGEAPPAAEKPAPEIQVATGIRRDVSWAERVVYNTLIGIMAVVLSLVAIGVLVIGWPYYILSATDRLTHPLHQWFSPGGPVGLWLGIGGSTLMVAMLSYSVRKFFLSWDWLGPPAIWFRFHVLCGIFGPILIGLHTAFLWPSGYIATGFWCMVLVALSGVFGRYVYGHFPRTAAGRSQTIEDSREELADLRAQLVAETKDADADQIGEAVQVVRDFDMETRSVFGWVVLHVEAGRRIDQVRALLHRSKMEPTMHRSAERTLTAQLKSHRNLGGWRATARLFSWWHLGHEPLAKAMYVLAFLHIIEAILIGGALQHLWRP